MLLQHLKWPFRCFHSLPEGFLSAQNVQMEHLYSLLQGCIRKGILSEARASYTLLVHYGLDSTTFFGTHLIRMFASCESLNDANIVFRKVQHHSSVYIWSSIISAHAKLFEFEQALQFYACFLQQETISPNGYMYVAILQACFDFQDGNLAHHQIVEQDFSSDTYVANALMDVYIRLGSLTDARSVFDFLHCQDIVSWNSMIGGYAKSGQCKHALDLFHLLESETCPCKPDVVTFNTLLSSYVCDGDLAGSLEILESMTMHGVAADDLTYSFLIKACTDVGALDAGLILHMSVIASFTCPSIMISNMLMDMYAKCGCLLDAQSVFNQVSHYGTVVTWNTMIACFVQNRKCHESLLCFRSIFQCCFFFDQVTVINTLGACAEGRHIWDGKWIHTYVVSSGLISEINVCNTLVDMYCKCEQIEYAFQLFDNMQQRDAITWNALITGCAGSSYNLKTFEFFQMMLECGLQPNCVTFIAILKACAAEGDLTAGRFIHTFILEYSYDHEQIIGNILIHMYAKCKSLSDAHEAFENLSTKDVVTWASLIGGYAENCSSLDALSLFQKMQDAGVEANGVLYVNVLKAIRSVESGNTKHCDILDKDLVCDSHVANSLISLYSKGGDLNEARKIFDSLWFQSVSSWNALISGCSQAGHDQQAYQRLEEMYDANINPEVETWNALLTGEGEAVKQPLELIYKMEEHEIAPDKITFMMALKSCADTLSLDQGQVIHAHAVRSGFDMNASVGSSLINLYTNSGIMEDAIKVFDLLPKHDVVLWNSLIGGCFSAEGGCKLAAHHFNEMLTKGIQPDEATFVSLLSVCSHFGDVQHASLYFNLMILDCKIQHTVDHFNCIIDILARAGFVIEGNDLLQSMPIKPDDVSWSCLLNHCQMYKTTELGKQCFDSLTIYDSLYDNSYVN